MQSRYCPNCGAEVSATSRYCQRCNFDMFARQDAPGANVQAMDRATPLPVSPMLTQTPFPQQGPISQPGFAPQEPVSQPGFGPQGAPPTSEPAWAYQQGLTPMPPSQPKRRGGIGRTLLIILLLLAFVGAGGYLAYALLVQNATQPQITSQTLSTTVKYAGVDVTLTRLEQAQRFIDDPHSAGDGMLRVHLLADNKTNVPVNMVYSDITRLVLPGGKVVQPTYVNGNAGLAAGKSHSDWVDFAVPSGTNTGQIALRLGGATEAQMDVSLGSNSGVSTYQPQTTQIGKALDSKESFYGLDWTLDSATTQWSIDGKQASKGMRYVTVTLKVNSALEQTAIPGSAFDYATLTAGSTTARPALTTLPVSFDKGTQGTSGTITFLVPQDQKHLTLTLHAPTGSGFTDATITFDVK